MTHGPGERPLAGHRFSPKCQVSALIVNGKTICISIKAIFTNNQGPCELLLIREASYQEFLKRNIENVGILSTLSYIVRMGQQLTQKESYRGFLLVFVFFYPFLKVSSAVV